jgi:tetratricopeptide (TPR) repeat protein
MYLCVGTAYAGRHQFHLGRLDRARMLLQRTITLCKQLGTGFGLSWAHAYLGDVEFVAQKLPAAKAAYEKALELANQGTKDEYSAPLALLGLAHTAALMGEPLAEVIRYAEEGMARFRVVSNFTTMAIGHQRYAEALEQLGQTDAAELERGQWLKYRDAQGGDDCDFWPRIMEGMSSSAIGLRREYWLSAAAHPPARGLERVDGDADTLIPQTPRTPKTPTRP